MVRQARGFTLIELLIVVAIIAIIAAIAVPGLLRARLNAQEGAAAAALRAISSSEANYAATCGSGGYATSLEDLVKPPPSVPFGFISPDLSANGVVKHGYTFTLEKNATADAIDIVTPSCNGAVAARSTSFYASAAPVTFGKTGTKYFATDTPGTIYVDTADPIPNPIPLGTSTLR